MIFQKYQIIKLTAKNISDSSRELSAAQKILLKASNQGRRRERTTKRSKRQASSSTKFTRSTGWRWASSCLRPSCCPSHWCKLHETSLMSGKTKLLTRVLCKIKYRRSPKLTKWVNVLKNILLLQLNEIKLYLSNWEAETFCSTTHSL